MSAVLVASNRSREFRQCSEQVINCGSTSFGLCDSFDERTTGHVSHLAGEKVSGLFKATEGISLGKGMHANSPQPPRRDGVARGWPGRSRSQDVRRRNHRTSHGPRPSERPASCVTCRGTLS
jgi:hypothetical protein